MLDRREAICARLPVIAKGITGIKKTARNEATATAKLGPWIVTHDGDETVLLNKPGAAPRIVEMTPSLRILVEAPAATVGTKLNGFRLALIRAITTDATLQELTGSNGEVRYDGCRMSSTSGEQKEGEMWIDFAISYPLMPPEL